MQTESNFATPVDGEFHKTSITKFLSPFFVLEILRAGVAVPTSCAPVAVNEPASTWSSMAEAVVAVTLTR